MDILHQRCRPLRDHVGGEILSLHAHDVAAECDHPRVDWRSAVIRYFGDDCEVARVNRTREVREGVVAHHLRSEVVAPALTRWRLGAFAGVSTTGRRLEELDQPFDDCANTQWDRAVVGWLHDHETSLHL